MEDLAELGKLALAGLAVFVGSFLLFAIFGDRKK